MVTIEQLKDDIDAILPGLIDIRHHLHAHPELALQEHETSAFLKKQLRSLNIEMLPPALGTDVIGRIHGTGEGPHIILRADMDALPIQEPAGKSYRSCNDGNMHACGHDGHTTMLLGAAMILKKYASEFSGSVRLVFQPGEENVAAGRDLVESGILDDPRPDLALAMHNMPGYPPGIFCSRPGPLMAAADFFKLTIKGRGGHGSMPEMCVDPIYVATRVLNALYQIPLRQFSALDSVVISPCIIRSGEGSNVIPDEAYIEGTVRYLTKEVGTKLADVFEAVVQAECDSAGAGYLLDYSRPYMPTINNGDAVNYCRQVVTDVFDSNHWVDVEKPIMCSEDFSFFLDRYPGAMVFLGNGEESPSLHNPMFDFNDEIIASGVLFFVSAVLNYSQQKG